MTFKLWNIIKTFLVSLRFTKQLQWAAPLYLPLIWQWSLTFSSSYPTYPHILFLFQSWSIFVKMLLRYFFTVFILFKNCFNLYSSRISTFINNNWFTKFIINTNKLVRKTPRNVFLIFFGVKTFIAFNTS